MWFLEANAHRLSTDGCLLSRMRLFLWLFLWDSKCPVVTGNTKLSRCIVPFVRSNSACPLVTETARASSAFSRRMHLLRWAMCKVLQCSTTNATIVHSPAGFPAFYFDLVSFNVARCVCPSYVDCARCWLNLVHKWILFSFHVNKNATGKNFSAWIPSFSIRSEQQFKKSIVYLFLRVRKIRL